MFGVGHKMSFEHRRTKEGEHAGTLEMLRDNIIHNVKPCFTADILNIGDIVLLSILVQKGFAEVNKIKFDPPLCFPQYLLNCFSDDSI